MKGLAAIVACITGLLLLSTITDFPAWGDPSAPANSGVASYYIRHSVEQTHVPNFVTAVLADYRGFDTMFETTVVFIAGMAIFLLLRQAPVKHAHNTPSTVFSKNIIVETTTRFLVPFMQLFALYVIAHGHHSPGGGFQGGVMLGSSLILFAIAFGLKPAMERMSIRVTLFLAALGVFIYAGIGIGCLLLKGNFLDYSVWHVLLPFTDTIMARSHGMLGVEIGVALTVMAILFSIYKDLVSHGKLDKGLE